MSDENKTERPLEERFETVDTTTKIHNGDAALQFLNNSVVAEMTPEDEKKLVRKIDWMIIPLMCTHLFPMQQRYFVFRMLTF